MTALISYRDGRVHEVSASSVTRADGSAAPRYRSVPVPTDLSLLLITSGRMSEVRRERIWMKCVQIHSWRWVWRYLQCFVWQLFVCPLLQFNIYGGVEGSRVRGLSGGKVDVLDDVGGDSLPQLLLQYGLPESRTSAQTSLSNTSCSPHKLEYIFTCVCVCGTHLS